MVLRNLGVGKGLGAYNSSREGGGEVPLYSHTKQILSLPLSTLCSEAFFFLLLLSLLFLLFWPFLSLANFGPHSHQV